MTAQRELFKVSHDAGAIFHGAAMRQLRRLQRLNEIPDDQWKAADHQLERHTMAMIKPLLEWCKLPMAGPSDISAAPSPQLSDGL